MSHPIIYPKPLQQGDTIAIVSPASIIDPELVTGAVAALTEQGFNVEVAPCALEHSGSYAAPAADRYADLEAALVNPRIRAVLCSRGGYGCVHLLQSLTRLPLTADPKWLIGFSDVSALHALMASHGIVSIHGSMAKALALHPITSRPNAMLMRLLAGHRDEVVLADYHPYNRLGTAAGRLVGGNLAVLQALMRTPFDIFAPGTILFIEDIAEPIYKVERILYQLRMAGILDHLAGLIIGRFTEYRPDRNYASMEDMLYDMLRDAPCPVAFNAAIGHVDDNLPLLHGAHATLRVTTGQTVLRYQ